MKKIYAKQHKRKVNLTACIFSTLLMWLIKILAHTFYSLRPRYIETDPSLLTKPWKDIRIIVFLNHTSLYEPLFIGLLPFWFIAKISKNLLVPVASKTYDRPIVGTFFKFLIANPVSVTRKRDRSWDEYMHAIDENSIICIAPEGRMKRPNGLDLDGNPMTVKGGIAEIIQKIEGGNILFAYSGGLHHVQKPGQFFPRLFQTIRMNIQLIPLNEYKKQFENEKFSLKAIRDDIQQKLDQNCPH